MKKTIFLNPGLWRGVGLIMLLAGIWGCSGPSGIENLNERVYATVNGENLTESGLRAMVPNDLFERLTEEHKANIIEEWIQNKLLYQEALKEGIDSETDIRRVLEQARQQLLSNELLERQLANVPEPSEAVLKTYYTGNSDLFLLESTEFRIRFALFDTKADVNDFHQRVKRNENFSDLARQSSKDPTSQEGGDLGVVNEDLVEPSVWEAVIATRTKYGVHKISDPFTVVDGWACIIIDDLFEAGTIKPFEHVRDLVADMYIAEQRQTAKQELIGRLTAGADIERYLESNTE